MKQQKRIIQHLIQQSKHNFKQCVQSSQQKVQQFNEYETIQSTADHDTHNISVQYQPTFTFQIYVQIGDGRSDIIYMNEKSDPIKQAENFCRKYKLENYIVELLAQSLADQAKKQRNMIKSQMNSEVLGQQQCKKIVGAQRLLSQNKLFKNSRNSKQLWKQPQQVLTGHPKINQISSQIVKKLGKNKIIETMNKKFHDKIQKYINQQIEKQEKQFEGYSFHPYINPISRKVDQTLNNSRQNLYRYEYLYEQHKVLQERKQERRRNSLNQISFKPNINKVSKTIMSRKRSLGDLYAFSNGKQKSKSNKNSKYLTKREEQQIKRKKVKSKQSLSTSTTNLCYHLYEQAKLRKQKISKQAQRIYKNPQNNWKIIQNSNFIASTTRQNRIKEIFRNLSKPPHNSLHHSQIDFNNLGEAEKIFMPVFKQMKDIDTDLNQEQFVQAGIRLLKYLNPYQKSILTRRHSNFQENQKQNIITASQINKKSQVIIKQKGYGQKDIYIRGLLYKRQVKNQIQKGKQQKVRKQLKNCTFKPKIHKIPKSIAY